MVKNALTGTNLFHCESIDLEEADGECTREVRGSDAGLPLKRFEPAKEYMIHISIALHHLGF